MLADLAVGTDVVLAELLPKQILLLGTILPRVGIRRARDEADFDGIDVETNLLFCPRIISLAPGHSGQENLRRCRAKSCRQVSRH